MEAMSRAVPLLHVLRGGLLESVHRGAIVVAEGDQLTLVRGDPAWVVFYRSTSKPLQALVGLTSGAADAFGFTPEELALAAGSHSTRPEHVATARGMLDKAGIPESALQCGGHFAFDAEERKRQQAETDTPCPIWSNCSGKHALMLATAKHLGLPLETYLDPAHPVQVEIRRHIALLGGIAAAEVGVGTDGCSAPAFAVPLAAMARSLARFGAPDPLPSELADAARRIGAAMQAHPFMIGGPGRFDTDLMESSAACLLAKAGAEGVHGTVAPERGLGLVVKAEDGSDRGYRLVVLTLLARLGLLSAEETEGLQLRHCDPVVRSIRGQEVGRRQVVI